MNICVLFGSPHKKGNTAALVDKYLSAQSDSSVLKRFDVVKMEIHPCMGCMACKKTGKGCIQRDDMDEIYPAITEADVIVFASPMYWWNVSGSLKNVIDRIFALPFNRKTGLSVLEGKKLQMIITSGQPESEWLRSELESMGKKMCDFTGMQWLGIVAAGNTGEISVDKQPEALKKAFMAGSTLANQEI